MKAWKINVIETYIYQPKCLVISITINSSMPTWESSGNNKILIIRSQGQAEDWLGDSSTGRTYTFRIGRLFWLKKLLQGPIQTLFGRSIHWWQEIIFQKLILGPAENAVENYFLIFNFFDSDSGWFSTMTFDSDQGRWQSYTPAEVCQGLCTSSESSADSPCWHTRASRTERPVTYFKIPNHQLEVITWRLQLLCSMPQCNCDQSGHRPTATR
jgi:hypothetical protein